MLVFAIVIGISKYQSGLLSSLPAAQADAIYFARALANWGIPQSHIFLCCSEIEKKENLEHILGKLSQQKEPFQLVFYFCGHGFRTAEPIPKSHLLFSNSEWIEDSLENAWEIDTLLQKLNELNTTNMYLFFDACHIRLNAILNPKLKEEILGKKVSKKSLFCLSSSGVFPSYESVECNYGFFTDALVKALSAIRQSERSLSLFFQLVQQELKGHDLADPEMYNVETHAIDFFPPLFPYISRGKLIRPKLIADVQDVIVNNREKALCIVGSKGSGKTTFARQMCASSLHTYWISTPASLKECYGYPSGSILVLDTGLKELKKIVEVLVNSPFTVMLLLDDGIADKELANFFVEFKMPPFMQKETLLLMQESHPVELDAEIYHLISKGNPQKLQLLTHNIKEQGCSPEESSQIKKTMAAVYACGVVINEELFRKTFSIELKYLSLLEKLGLIFQEEGSWRFHNFLMEIVELEQLELDRVKTLSYWSAQCEELPNHFLSALNLVLTMQCFGYEPELDANLKAAFEVLYAHGKKGVEGLKIGAALLHSSNAITSSALFLAEALLEWGEFDLVKRLLQPKTAASKLNLQAQISYSHILWRTGLFSSCIKETTLLIDTLSFSVEKMQCYLHRGASHFFLGNWDEAAMDFSFIDQRGRHPIYVGRARCLLGTILGIRGVDIEQGKELVESGVKVLTKNDDLMGAWIGWNNLGEIMWKSGNPRSSAYYLQKALEIAEGANNSSMLLETLRNLLQLEFYASYPNLSQLNQIIERIELSLESANEIVEAMQVYNTLSTVCMYLEDYKKARSYLKKALPLTITSKEYHIYTLANLSLLFNIYGMKEKAHSYFERACALAQKGNNLFAIRQIELNYSKLQLFCDGLCHYEI